MNWDMIFTITNSYALLMWIILLIGPRQPAIMTGLFYGGIGLLASGYAVIIIPLMTGMIDGGGSAASDFTTLAGVQQLLASPGGATIGWIHYLAFDLFAGLWIARDLFVGLWVARNADKYGFARWLQIPILLLVYVLGPLGLVLYLLLRFTRHNKVADAVMP